MKKLSFILLAILLIGLALFLQKNSNKASSIEAEPIQQSKESAFFANLNDEFQRIDKNLNIKSSEGFILVSAIKSNDGKRVVYSEIEECIELLHQRGNYHDQDCPKPDYHIYVKELESGETKLIYSFQENSLPWYAKLTNFFIKEAHAGGTPLAVSPIGWSKNDKYIIGKWVNILPTGSGGIPPYTSYTLNPDSGELKPLGHSLFYDNFGKVIVSANNPDSLPICGPAPEFNSTRILVKDVETGEFQIILDNHEVYHQGIKVEENTLFYLPRNMTQPDANHSYKCAEVDWSDDVPVKTIVLP